MIKESNNEIAAKVFARAWVEADSASARVLRLLRYATRRRPLVGKHYGKGDERYGDPVANHSHAATVRQLLRTTCCWNRQTGFTSGFEAMREIFASPDIPHLNDKFVKGLEGREAQVLRKSGWWRTGSRHGHRHGRRAALHRRGDDASSPR